MLIWLIHYIKQCDKEMLDWIKNMDLNYIRISTVCLSAKINNLSSIVFIDGLQCSSFKSYKEFASHVRLHVATF